MARAAKKEEKIVFEEAMQELEGIVAKLEDGELPLEEAVAAYERGVVLVKGLEGVLKDARRRVSVWTDTGEKPFEEDDNEAT